MLPQWQHVAGLGIAVAGTAFAASFGGAVAVVSAYALALALGVVVYLQGEGFAAAGSVSGNILLGYVGGVVLSLATATALLVYFINLPLDFAAWQMGLQMWNSWAGIGVAVLSGFFLAGVASLLN